ncbi:MAG: enoyl-CoA hydratase/isomerase family protein [Dehalococcoidia bacterium]
MALSWPHEKILYEKDGHVAIVTKNNPEKLNALDPEMRAAQLEALADAEDDPEIRVIVVTGAGRGWNPGANPGMFQQRSEAGYRLPPWKRPHGERDVSPFRRSDKLVIGAINGYAYGSGMGEALWCDLRILAESARLGPVWAKFAAPMEQGTSVSLPMLVGVAKALELYALAEPIPAAKALELGLANWVVPDDQLQTFAREIAHKVARNSPFGTALTKWMLYRYAAPDIEHQLELFRWAEDYTARTEDMLEGGRAFREKRAPQFRGR